MFSLTATDIGVFSRMITGNVFFKIEIKKKLKKFYSSTAAMASRMRSFDQAPVIQRVDGVTIKSIIISVQHVSIGY